MHKNGIKCTFSDINGKKLEYVPNSASENEINMGRLRKRCDEIIFENMVDFFNKYAKILVAENGA